MHNDIKEVLVSEEQILNICSMLGKQITSDYKDKDLYVLGLLKGCIPFMADLSKKIELKVPFGFMDVSSYHGATESSGNVKINYDLQENIRDKHVLIVEDIVDTGRTLKNVVSLLEHRGAASVEVVTLLDKPGGRVVEFTPKYIGETIPTEFVVGYGLDYDEIYRNLPYVGILKKEVYTK